MWTTTAHGKYIRAHKVVKALVWELNYLWMQPEQRRCEYQRKHTHWTDKKAAGEGIKAIAQIANTCVDPIDIHHLWGGPDITIDASYGCICLYSIMWCSISCDYVMWFGHVTGVTWYSHVILVMWYGHVIYLIWSFLQILVPFQWNLPATCHGILIFW